MSVSYISIPGLPPAYQAWTIALEMGLQCLSFTTPATVILVSGVNSLVGVSWCLSGAPWKNEIKY